MTQDAKQTSPQTHTGYVNDIEDHSEDSAGTHHRLQIDSQWFSLHGEALDVVKGDMIAIEYVEKPGGKIITNLVPLPDNAVNESPDMQTKGVCLKVAGKIAETHAQNKEAIIEPQTVTSWADQFVDWMQDTDT